MSKPYRTHVCERPQVIVNLSTVAAADANPLVTTAAGDEFLSSVADWEQLEAGTTQAVQHTSPDAAMRVLARRIAQIQATLVAARSSATHYNLFARTATDLGRQGSPPKIIIDPQFKGDYLPWLLTDLLENAIVLGKLGDTEGQRIMITILNDWTDLILRAAVSKPAGIPLGNIAAYFVGGAVTGQGQTLQEYPLLKKRYMTSVNNLITANDASKQAFQAFNQQLKVAALPTTAALPNGANVPPLSAEYTSASDDQVFARQFPTWLDLRPRAVEAFFETTGASLPSARRCVLLGGGDGHEPLTAARRPDLFQEVVSVDHSAVATRRSGLITQRIGGLLSLAKIMAVQADVATYDYGENTTSLFVSNHLIEFLSADKLKLLAPKIQKALVKGGQFLIIVHLQRGTAFTNFSSNPSVHRIPDTDRFQSLETLPDGRQVGYKKNFYTSGAALKQEWQGLGFAAAYRLEVEELGEDRDGWVEAKLIITKR